MKLFINQEEYKSALKSYNNLFAHFLIAKNQPANYKACIYKWGIQLGIAKEDLEYIINNPASIKFKKPGSTKEAIAQVYDLVNIIFLDEIIEDVELSVAGAYAEGLGFKPYIISDLLKALVKSPDKGIDREQVQNEMKELITKTPT
jgi:hypothetical protein